MFAPPKKRTGAQPSNKKHGTDKKVDVKSLVKDLSSSYRQLDDYVTKENEDKKKWNQHSPDNISSKQRNGSTTEKQEKQSPKMISSLTSAALESSTTKTPRKSENIYADDDEVEKPTDRTPITDDMRSLLDAYPKKFHELRQIMEEMKERHTKSINRMRQKLKKDALKHEEEVREATKQEAQAEADKLRHLLKVQRAKSQRAMESMKLEKQKLINSQAKSNKSLRQTENKLADMQKGLYTLKKQLAKSQREKAMSEQGRVELRSKAVKQKKRADELQRDIKSLESGIETVRLLNRQNENITQHDYDVLHWKYRSIVKLVREVESIATPPDLGKTPSLQTIMEARNGRGSRVRLPAIGYPRRLPIKGAEQRAYNGREKRLIVYPQRQVVHQVPRRKNLNETKVKTNEEETLALPMPEKKRRDSRDSSASSSSSTTSSNRSKSESSRRSDRKNDNEKEKSDDYASDFESDNASDSMLAITMPDATQDDGRRSSSTRRSTSDSVSTNQTHSGASQRSEKTRVQSVASDEDLENKSSDDLSSNVAPDNTDAEQTTGSGNEPQEDQDSEKKDAQKEDSSVFLT